MKAALVLVTGLFVSLSSFAVQEGVFHCASKDSSAQITYKISTLSAGAVSVPVLEITSTLVTDGASQTFNVKGIATLFTNDKGAETLTLGNHVIELTAGRPSCAQ